MNWEDLPAVPPCSWCETEPALLPGRFAYADPPYPGTARRYYRHHPDYAGEVDHKALVASLCCESYTGWALSTSAAALRDVLPLCPPEARVCPWVKPHGVSGRTNGLHNAWEALIVVGGRQRPPGRRDWLSTHTARLGGSDLMGRKPILFCAFLFGALGMAPGDSLLDVFPGTGAVARAWREISRRPPRPPELGAGAVLHQPQLPGLSDTSPQPAGAT